MKNIQIFFYDYDLMIISPFFYLFFLFSESGKKNGFFWGGGE